MSKSIRTTTETLMAALEDCENADSVFIIMCTKDEISWHTNIYSTTEKLGLLDFVQTYIRQCIVDANGRKQLEKD